MSSKQQRKNEAKKKRRRKDELKRKAILDKPPTSLRVVDKLCLCALQVTQWKPDMIKEIAESTGALVHVASTGEIPVYLADDVVEWLRMKFPEKVEISTELIGEMMGEISTEFAPCWVEASYTSKHGVGLRHQPACGIYFWNADEMATDLPEMYRYMVNGLRGGRGYPDFKGAFHFKTFYTTPTQAYTETVPCEMFIPMGHDNLPGDAFTRDGYRDGLSEQEREYYRNQAMTTSLMGLATMSFLSTHNVKTKGITPKPSRAEIKYAEAARRKLPEYEQRVVDLWPERVKEHKDGDGESTGTGRKRRWHKVVGHFYTRNGKKWWRRGHSRGDKRLGTVQNRKRVRLDLDKA